MPLSSSTHNTSAAHPTVVPQHRSIMSRLTGPKSRRALPGERVYDEPVVRREQVHHHHTHNTRATSSGSGLFSRNKTSNSGGILAGNGRNTIGNGVGPTATGTGTRLGLHKKRKVSTADKVSGAMMKMKGAVEGKPGKKAEGERRMRAGRGKFW